MSIFVYPEQAPQIKLETVGEDSNKRYRLHRLEFDSYGINGQKDNLISADFQMSKQPGKNPLLIVLPLYGSYTYPSDEISAGVASHTNGGYGKRRCLQCYVACA